MTRARDLANVADDVSTGTVVTTASPSLGRRNIILNGSMAVAQRGTSTSVGVGGYTFSCDRFSGRASIGSNHTLDQVTDAPNGFTNSAKFTVGTGATPSGTDYVRLLYKFEGYDVVQFEYGQSSAKTVTVSFWVKSSVTGTFGLALKHTTTRNIVGSYTVSQANTWEYVSVSLAGDTTTAIANKTNGEALTLGFDLGEGPDRSRSTGSWGNTSNTQWGLDGGTKVVATSGATWQITGVQLEVGTVATPFEHRSYGEELALCQRYYEKAEVNFRHFTTASGQYLRPYLQFATTKRAEPDVTGTLVTENGMTYSGANTQVSIESVGLDFRSTGSSGSSFAYYNFTFDAEL